MDASKNVSATDNLEALSGPPSSLLATSEEISTTHGATPSPHNSFVTTTRTSASEYPKPSSLTADDEFVWDEGSPPAKNYAALGQRLFATGDVYRAPKYAWGLIIASSDSSVPLTHIKDGKHLSPILIDRVPLRVEKDGEYKGGLLPSRHLQSMLASEVFLQQFSAIDDVCGTAQYFGDFELTKPGYNDGGPGRRFLYTGPTVQIESSPETVEAFLNVMDFETGADRTNAVAAALTVMLRHRWPGAKPVIVATSSKSHGGKDTVIQFACGTNQHVSISYQTTDWAMERSFVGAIAHRPQTGVVIVENARLGKGARVIASAFLERLITDPEPFFFSTGTGAPVSHKNHLVLAISTNFGTISEDLMNRALPIRLNPVGDVADRVSPIGNPKFESLPANRQRIESELHRMTEKWKAAGKPLDSGAKHPFTEWARTIGGILKVNGFSQFLANYSLRRTADDPVRQALAILGSAGSMCWKPPNDWKRPDEWAKLALEQGLVKSLIPEAERDSPRGRARAIGVALSAHRGESFAVETDDRRLTLLLEKARRRFGSDTEPTTRYRFAVEKSEEVSEDVKGQVIRDNAKIPK